MRLFQSAKQTLFSDSLASKPVSLHEYERGAHNGTNSELMKVEIATLRSKSMILGEPSPHGISINVSYVALRDSQSDCMNTSKGPTYSTNSRFAKLEIAKRVNSTREIKCTRPHGRSINVSYGKCSSTPISRSQIMTISLQPRCSNGV